MNRKLIALTFLACTLSTPLAANEPRTITSPAALPDGMGAIRISVRSQLQLGGPLRVWFVREDGALQGEQHALRIDRTQGVPLAGTNMIDSRPRVVAVQPGHYRLAAHNLICEQLPPPGAVCMLNGNPLPTANYTAPSIEFDVVKGELTDAGEYVLELPVGTDLGGSVSYKQAFKQMQGSAIRWRPIAAAVPADFAGMKQVPSPGVSDEFRSNLQCEIKPKNVKGMSLFYPFDC